MSEKSGEKEEKMSVEEKLKIVYSDKDIIVRMAPNEEELKNILLELLDEKSMNLKELHAVLSGIASEDKIRKALARLAEKGLIVLQEDGRYARLGTS